MTNPVILLGTQSNGETLPVQVDATGRLVAEGLPGPEGPPGPPGIGQLPPNPQNGDVLAWDDGLVWVSGIIPAAPPETAEIIQVGVDVVLYSRTCSVTGPGAFSPAGNELSNIFDADPDNLGAVEGSDESVAIVWDASSYNLDTANEAIRCRQAGGRTFTVTGTLGTADTVVSTDPEGSPLPYVGILQEVRVTGNGANWFWVKNNGELLVDGTPQVSLTFASDKDLDKFNSGDAVVQDDEAASGSVGSIDIGNNKMVLAQTSGVWGPANDGRYVIGPQQARYRVNQHPHR